MSIGIFVIICSVFVITNTIDIPFSLPENQIKISNISSIISFLVIMFFYLYSLSKKSAITLLEMQEKEAIQKKKTLTHKTSNQDKFKELYNRIILYFEKEKPYCDPNFTILKLSLAINSSTAHIAKAIKMNRNTNFNFFVNKYRIRMVKEMLDKDWQNKYTIKYIHLSAGFNHQSTFNKVFKEIEGITPSEYIKHKATWIQGTTSSLETI